MKRAQVGAVVDAGDDPVDIGGQGLDGQTAAVGRCSVNPMPLTNSMTQPMDKDNCTCFWGHVLVAEDARASQILIRKLLEKYGLEVDIVENGHQAVRKAAESTYDLIFMDMNMPEMSGYDATQHLREQGYVAPIVALTASAMKGDEEKCIRVGCDAYISKPINRQELLSLLKQYLPADSGQDPPNAPVCRIRHDSEKENYNDL